MGIVRRSFLAAFLGILAAAPGVAAQGANLAFAYRVKVHVGQEQAFEAALREHMAVRQAAGEPFQWLIYQAMFGDDGGEYYVRSADHSWADLDMYNGMGDFQEEVGDHFTRTMTPFIAESSSWVSVLDTAMSAMPPNMDEMNVFMVNRIWVDGEGAMAMEEALGAFHETAAANHMYHIVLRTLVCGQGSDLALVFPAENFAGLEEPSPGMDELMMQEHGQEGLRDIYESWLSGLEESSSSVLVLRRDLSGMGGG